MKFDKRTKLARERFAIQILSKNPLMTDAELNDSMKEKFGFAVHYKTAKVLRAEAKKLTSERVNNSWKDEQTMAPKKAKAAPVVTLKSIDPTDVNTGEEELKELALQMFKVMENTSIVSVHVYEENGQGHMTLGVKKIEKRKVQLEPTSEA